eukprot:3168491-Amphidinium_carterae.1
MTKQALRRSPIQIYLVDWKSDLPHSGNRFYQISCVHKPIFQDSTFHVPRRGEHVCKDVNRKDKLLSQAKRHSQEKRPKEDISQDAFKKQRRRTRNSEVARETAGRIESRSVP